MNLKKNVQDAKIDLVKELGIDKLPKEKREELLVQMGEVLQQRIILRIVEEFPSDKKDELLKMLEEKKDSPDEINSFIETNLSNAEDLIVEEIGEYKRESIEFISGALGDQHDK